MSADNLKVTGNLTIRNVTRPVTLDVKVLKLGSKPRTNVATVGFNATGMLKRSDFKLDAFVPQVGDEIALQITCQGAEAKAQAALLKARGGRVEDQKEVTGRLVGMLRRNPFTCLQIRGALEYPSRPFLIPLLHRQPQTGG